MYIHAPYPTLFNSILIQLIYDYTEGSGTFGFICLDKDKVPSATLKSFRMIGIDIPPEYMRYLFSVIWLVLLLLYSIQKNQGKRDIRYFLGSCSWHKVNQGMPRTY